MNLYQNVETIKFKFSEDLIELFNNKNKINDFIVN